MRDKPRADGAPWILKIAGQGTVSMNATVVYVDRIVADAWGELAPPVTSKVYRKDKFKDRPASSYEDGRVIHITEYRAEMARVDN